MQDEWTRHRFSGGALALDLVNTVVHRMDAARRFDRLGGAEAANRFAHAAARHCIAEFGGAPEFARVTEADMPRLTELREAIHVSFAPGGRLASGRMNGLADLLSASARAIAASGEDSLAGHAVLSWMGLSPPGQRDRVRACPNCSWLFFDRSRNRSRIWCDMAVCGNRNKAKLSYRRKRDETTEMAA